MAKDEQTLLAKVNAQIAKSNWSAALKAAQTASKRCPDQPEFTNLAGFALAQMGRPKEAAIRFAAANWQAPGRRDIAINLLQAVAIGVHSCMGLHWGPSRLHFHCMLPIFTHNSLSFEQIPTSSRV